MHISVRSCLTRRRVALSICKKRCLSQRRACLASHASLTSIVPVYDLSVDADGTVVFTMKRLRGRTLEDILIGLRENRSEDVAAFSRTACSPYSPRTASPSRLRTRGASCTGFSSPALCRQSDWLFRVGKTRGKPVIHSV